MEGRCVIYASGQEPSSSICSDEMELTMKKLIGLEYAVYWREELTRKIALGHEGRSNIYAEGR